MIRNRPAGTILIGELKFRNILVDLRVGGRIRLE
jgi:hypothetical protein